MSRAGAAKSGRLHWRLRAAAWCTLVLACEADRSDSGEAPGPLATEPAPAVEIARAESWALANATRDPFLRFEPGRVRCAQTAVQPEGTWLEVRTLDCNYATLVVAFSTAAPAGSVLRGELAWSTLAAIDPAVATLAFALGERELWTRQVAIPAEADLIDVELALPAAASAGDPLYFHFHNHGYNSWQLSPLLLTPP